MAIFQRTLTATAAAATVFAALAMPAWAQAPATATPAVATAVQPAERAKADGQHQRDHQAHAKRIANKSQKFQAALQLTESQQAGWKTYREAVKPAPQAKRLDREAFAKLTTPQRIQQLQQQRTERNVQADRRDAATTAFYATLSPAQQATFDAQTLRHGKHAGKHTRKHHGHHAKHHAAGHAAQTGTAAPAAAGPAK